MLSNNYEFLLYGICSLVCSMESDQEYKFLPAEIEEAANKATFELLPSKSKQQYEFSYDRFLKWCDQKNVSGKEASEKVLLAYFEEKSKIWKSSTLWSNYSMLKAMMNINNQDISKYYKLVAFLKRKGEGYRPKKSKILSSEQIDKFLAEAPDEIYLMQKVAAIFGVFGACRREELCNLTLNNIEDLGTSLVVHIPDTKTNVQRTFVISGTLYMNYYKKYLALRPLDTNHQRIFIKCTKNKCARTPVGINTFGKMPAKIAEFLNLPDSHLYTGHCFRRSSASLLAESGANLTTIKRHGGWKSSTVAEGYIEDSLQNKKNIAGQILSKTSEDNVVSCPGTSFTKINSVTATNEIGHGVSYSNCSFTNCRFN